MPSAIAGQNSTQRWREYRLLAGEDSLPSDTGDGRTFVDEPPAWKSDASKVALTWRLAVIIYRLEPAARRPPADVDAGRERLPLASRDVVYEGR